MSNGSTREGGWTDRGLSATDNLDGTVTFNVGGDTGASDSAGRILALCNGPGQELVRRLALGNITSEGVRSARSSTSVTFSKTITYAESQAVRLHGQVTNSPSGMST